MLKKLKNKEFAISVCSIALLIIMVISATFAYLSGSGGSLTRDMVVTSSTTDALTFNVSDEINIKVNKLSFLSGAGNKYGEAYITAMLTPNSSNGTSTGSYYAYLNISKNEMRYSAANENRDPELLLQVFDSNNQLVTLTGLGEQKTVKGLTGYDITGRTGLVTLLDDHEITASNSTTSNELWKVRITLVNLDVRQQENLDKEVVASILVQKDQHPNQNLATFTVTVDANGGESETESFPVIQGEEIGELPEVSRTNYYLYMWVDGLVTMNEVDEHTIPQNDMYIVAVWRKSLEAATITNSTINLENDESETIIISNANEIEEPYTFTSSNTSIATVDQNGVVTGSDNTAGTATITITGTNSGKTKTVTVNVSLVHYTLTFMANNGSGTMTAQSVDTSGTVRIKANEYTRTGYVFAGWNTSDDGNGTAYFDEEKITNLGDTTLYAQWREDNFPYMFRQLGECVFTATTNTKDANTGNVSGAECTEYATTTTGKQLIDTGVQLYADETTKAKDYEIGFTIVHYTAAEQGSVTQATLMNTKKESTGYPGLVFRRSTGSGSERFEIASRRTSSANSTRYIENPENLSSVRIIRKNNAIYSSVNGEAVDWTAPINNLSSYNPVFSQAVFFGGTATSSGGTQRHINGIMKNMYIRLGTYEDPSEYIITFDQNISNTAKNYKAVYIGDKYGKMPEPTRSGYTFVGWYDAASGGNLVDESDIPIADTILYAHWEED